jgi:hypothetical protein
MYSIPSLMQIKEAKDDRKRRGRGVVSRINTIISFCQKLKSRVSFIQLKRIFDIVLRGFSLSSCPRQYESPLALKSHMSFKVHTLWEQVKKKKGKDTPARGPRG